ncbi:MAG: hypothetical protein IKZ96_00205 [Bacilli bacterium]|nr:hypothetical protein [Bacilli bacterium]
MEKTKFYTVNELMQMGSIKKRINTKTIFPVTKDDKGQLAFAGAVSPKMLMNLVEIPKTEPIVEERPVKGQISIFSLGKKTNAKRNR